ncbi:hypothetical protein B0J14DRAFT_598980 [Halenospora varia]|nr:hypothetical protein B0J14DRAFT_598980 [Halenospora varia]
MHRRYKSIFMDFLSIQFLLFLHSFSTTKSPSPCFTDLLKYIRHDGGRKKRGSTMHDMNYHVIPKCSFTKSRP